MERDWAGRARRLRWLRRASLTAALLVLLTACLGASMTGSTAGLSFPRRAESDYVLPWAAGESHRCTQGNQSLVTHRGEHRTSWDFLMWLGTPVLAAREGTVVEVHDQASDLPGLHRGNRVIVRHEDGSTAIYAHLDGDGMRVSVGDRVRRRTPIGVAGMSGMTLYPHLHFQVRDPGGKPMAVSFRDLDEPDGVPRTWRAYVAE